MSDDINNILNGTGQDQAEPTQTWSGASDSELASAEAAESEYQGSPKSALNRNTITLFLACLFGLGLTFGLRQKPQKASAQTQALEAKVDMALAKFVDPQQKEKTKKLFENTEKMVHAFYDYPAKQQVAADELQRNPFSRLMARDEDARNVNDAQQRRQELRLALTEKVGHLSLQSVLRGPNSSKCLINGQVYGQGDTIDTAFTVKSIRDKEVVLLAEGMTFKLLMQ